LINYRFQTNWSTEVTNGCSDVEEGLTKITGITKVSQGFIRIRGLEDRYSNLLIELQAHRTVLLLKSSH
jgi:hypothetical protein